MKSIKTYDSFQSYLQGRKELETPDRDTNVDDCRKLLHLVREYRHAEDAYYEKLKRNQFAVNEKDQLMRLRKQIDFYMYTIHL